jgi:hypothetical protein
MAGIWHRHIFCVFVTAVVTAIGLLANPAVGVAQSSREADGARLLKGALDLHFHMDPWTPGALTGQAGIADVRVARSRGMPDASKITTNRRRARLPPSDSRPELRRLFVLNLPNGGINPAGVEFGDATKGEPTHRLDAGGRWGKEVRDRRTRNHLLVACRNGSLHPR